MRGQFSYNINDELIAKLFTNLISYENGPYQKEKFISINYLNNNNNP